MVEREIERKRDIVVFSDNADFVSGLLQTGEFNVIHVFSSTPKLTSAIKACVTTPLERISTLCPGGAEESTARLLSILSSYEDIDIIIFNYPYQVSKDFLEKFPGKIFQSEDADPKHLKQLTHNESILPTEIPYQLHGARVDFVARDIA